MALGKTIDHYFKFILIILLFLLLSFNQDLAMIYILIIFADYVWYKSDNFISFPLSRGSNSGLITYFEAFAGFGAVMLASYALINFFSPSTATAGLQSMFNLFATITPVLADSKILTVISYAVLIPIIETSFFNGRLLEGLATYSEIITGKKVDLNSASLGLTVIILVVAALFALYHITAYNLQSTPLLVAFIFSIISSVLVLRQRELKGAIVLHILVNTVGVASAMGWI